MSARGHHSPLERRRVQRVWLEEPLSGAAESLEIRVTDLSRFGIGIVHSEPLPYVGEPVVLKVDWNGETIDLHCEVRRTSIRGDSHARPHRFHSGLTILFSDTMSAHALRELIATHIRIELRNRKRTSRPSAPHSPSA